jgi:two-component system phosphate regulon sensor histidine kinase PhoR
MYSTPKDQIILVISDPQVRFLVERVLATGDHIVRACQDRAQALETVETVTPNLFIISERLIDSSGIEFAAELVRRFPTAPIILFVENDTPELLKKAMRVGVSDYLCLPLRADEVIRSVQHCLEKAIQRKTWVLTEAKRATASLQRRVDELETIAALGKTITSSLDLDGVFSAIVSAAVELTGAEEGSLLLIDEETGELYMRAARNFQDEFIRTFRLPIKDSLVSQVIQTGQPFLLDENTPQKIKTAYLVHSLIYVPLQLHGRVFGVLGVDNRLKRLPFKERDVKLLSAIAEFAVIAVDNARLYSNTNQERQRLESILTQIQDGVVVLDKNHKVVLVNQAARNILQLNEQSVTGKKLSDVVHHTDLVNLITHLGEEASARSELTTEDGRVFDCWVSEIPGIGLAISMHDITYLKKIDRIKSDFVSAISHDLRSPLTAIMGYIELIERAGSINEIQREYIQRVQTSVQNITSLVNEMLNLGRIEAGLDTKRENVQLDKLVHYSVDGMITQLTKKNIHVKIEFSNGAPIVLANPVQMRQVIDNLLDNAIKYTPDNGTITIRGGVEEEQVILQFQDNGIGIPTSDLPFVFDKFFRGSNLARGTPGTGLGLAIVKTIVENHGGRVWVDSAVGRGSTFTVVFPLAKS